MPEDEPTLKQSADEAGQIICPSCRRALVISGDRPLFCAYCGSSLDQTEAEPSSATVAAELDRTTTHVEGAATSDHQSQSPRAGGEAIPDRIDGYRLIRRLGAGGMGTVFEAVDERQGRAVALKLITRDYVASDESIQRFRQEAKMASAVTHPRCVFVLAVDDDRGRPYLVMELMPGATLQSLVEQKGRLEPADAILKIFDVIEGLEEFHKLGVIHRDVKPANCFLEADGRVKIGDFGLSKAVEGGVDLTRTGAFLGTPLYASPEQIKRDPLDERTDVYSVAATLYYLMSKHPPVQAKDAAEALARVVSEPAPPLSVFAPKVPRALEAVVQKGLERDRSRRWRNLREFHDALLPFVPERVNIAAIGLRVGAYLLDLLLYYMTAWAFFALVLLAFRGRFFHAVAFFDAHALAIHLGEAAIWVAYFTIAGGWFGASLGKWIVGLRVARADGGSPPGLARSAVRILCFASVMGLGFEPLINRVGGISSVDELRRWGLWILVKAVGLLIIVSTMRRRSGARGLHEWVSGTRVVEAVGGGRVKPFPRLRRLAARKLVRSAPGPVADGPSRIGPYEVRGVVRAGGRGKVLAGRDSTLDRRAWILLRSPGAAPPWPSRRTLNRLTRPRWIGGGDEPQWRWDAFTAPSGHPLAEVVEAGGLPWSDALPLLMDLAEELEAAQGDGTLPLKLSTDQIWVRHDGRVQIFDPLGWDAAAIGSEERPDEDAAIGEARALAFLGEVARLTLEGGRARRDSSRPDIRAAVPRRARAILDRLVGERDPYNRLADARADLVAAAERPVEVTASRRVVQLAIQTFLIGPSLLLLIVLTYPEILLNELPASTPWVAVIPFVWVFWAILTRGGLSYRLAGLALVWEDGGLAGRWACGLRALLAWGPPSALMLGSLYLQYQIPEAVLSSWVLWSAGAVLLAVFGVLAILFPGRGLHDRLSRTVVVPT